MKQLFFLLLALVLHTPLSAASAHHETLSTNCQHKPSSLFSPEIGAVISRVCCDHDEITNQFDLTAAPTAAYAPLGILRAQTSFSSLSLHSRSWQRSVATRAPPFLSVV